MAVLGGGKVQCRVCGATSTKADFGTEPNRKVATTRAPLSGDPVTTHRRNRAKLLRSLNRKA
jgi:hypothetical protein